ncbi:hypothetical protein L7F22_035988 [Adiantum nelumboides]|nr:hypothetical protein [Adiantum nelumboides]
MAPKNTSPGGNPGANKGASTTGGDASPTPDSTVMCWMQDVWGFLNSLQNTITKQSDEIKNLALKNQDLEHKYQMQNLKITLLEEQVQKLQATCDKQMVNLQDAMTLHEEKLTQMHEKTQLNVQQIVGSWGQIARNGSAGSHPTSALNVIQDIEEIKEYNEKEKRKMNIVVRGMVESDKEQVATLNMEVTDMLSDKFGMSDVVDVWGFLISLQNTITKQSDEIKNLALKNQDLEHKYQMQNLKITLLEEHVQKLQAPCDKQMVNLQDAMTLHEEKLTQMHEKTQLNVQQIVGSWGQIARNGSAGSHPTSALNDIQDIEEIKEYNEKEKRKMNIVVRGMVESDKE